MTTKFQAARDKAVATFSARIERITALITDIGARSPDAHVVRVGPHLYVGASIEQLTGIEAATVWRDLSHAQANAIHVRNGNGDRGQAAPYAQALQDELAHLTSMRDLIAA